MKTLFCFFLFFALFHNAIGQQKIAFKILKGSTLSIKGTTNVKAPFHCASKESFSLTDYDMQTRTSNDTIVVDFKNAVIQVPTTSFICENDGMTEDMHNALKAEDYPTISLQIIQASIPAKNPAAASIAADLTITGVTKRISVALAVEQFNPNLYRLTGEKDLLMTDFKITPPTALMGLIKVRNHIKITLDFKAQMQ